MKSYLLRAIVLIAICFAPNAIKAQIISHSEIDSCFDFVFRANSQPGPNREITTYFGDGNWQTNGAGVVYALGNKHKYLLPGTYTVKHVLWENSVPTKLIDSVQFTVTTTLCNHVTIRIYNDLNSNCLYDNGDNYFWGGAHFVEIDSAGVKIDTITAYGPYTYKRFTQGKTYSFKLLNPPVGTIATCPANAIVTVTIPTAINTTYIDFGVQCGVSSQYDLLISYLKGYYRPANYSTLKAWGINNSCNSQNGTMSVTFSNKYNFVSAFPTPASVVGNIVTWNFNNINSQSSVSGLIKLTPAVTINFGDTICAQAYISPTSGDVNTANNSMAKCDTVKSSWDPNSKEVSPAGAIMPGTKLEYTINFENLGNDTAFNIHILDTLSENVDPNSFSMITSSHRASASLLTGTNGKKIMRFEFNDIMLPDSSHPEWNKGFVAFSINVKNGLMPLTQIENRAGIYFDVNPVVMTNTALNWIKGVGIDDVSNSKPLHIYPNPNDGHFIIKADVNQYNNAKLMNSLGQVVATQALTGNETKMNVKALPAGIYYMMLTGPAGNTAERIEKQ